MTTNFPIISSKKKSSSSSQNKYPIKPPSWKFGIKKPKPLKTPTTGSKIKGFSV